MPLPVQTDNGVYGGINSPDDTPVFSTPDNPVTYDAQGRPHITVGGPVGNDNIPTSIQISNTQPSLGDTYLDAKDDITPPQVSTPLADSYLDAKDETDLTHPSQTEKGVGDYLNSVGTGAIQGASDVVNTGGEAIGWLDKTIAKLIGGNGQQRSDAFNARVNQENETFQQQYGDDPLAQIGRIGGQIAATAPLTPVRGIQALKAAAGALPTVLSTGERVAAGLIPRLLGASGAGAIGGATYGAATSSTTPETGVLPVAGNIAANAVGGAIGGPIMEEAGNLISKAPGAIRGAMAKGAQNVASNAAGVNPKAASKVLEQFNNEGMSIDEAQNEIHRMGPDATIADLTPEFQEYAGALAAREGRASAIVHNRFAARNELKNDVAHTEIDKAIGPKPDIEAEKQKILDKAYKDVKPDYDAAHNSGDKLDVTPILKDIDKKANLALGEKRRHLLNVKSYLHKKIVDVNGDTISVPRTSVEELHETRMAIDNDLSKAKPPFTSVGNQTKTMLTDMRGKVDDLLKSNPQMKAADEKFSKATGLTKSIDYGYKEALNNSVSKEQFMKTWSAASANEKEAIKKGLRAVIGDKMDSAEQGELAGAQRQFGKKSAARAKLKLAFGAAGDKVLDTLSTQANLRATEKFVAVRSATAKAQRINNSLDIANKATSLIGDMVKGFAVDASTGSLGSGTAVMGAKHIGGNILTRWNEKRHDAFAEGLADLLSRSGHGLDVTFDQLRKIQGVKNIVNPAQRVQGALRQKLPIASVAAPLVGLPIAKAGYNKLKALIQ